ncbi:MAG TPA: hypothetical protein VGC70_05440 [Burkholderiales bacterium]
MSDEAVRVFLSDSLAMWGVEGVVEPGAGAVLAVIRARTGTIVWVERVAARDIPFRWTVRSRAAGESAGGAREVRPKACSALAGMLKAVRNALGIDRGSPIRIAPQHDAGSR